MNPVSKISFLSVIIGALAVGGCSLKETERAEYPAAKEFAGAVTLKIVTFNVWDSYVFPDHRERMREIGRFLAELDPDLVGLQEAFVESDRELLLEQLEDSRLKYWKYYPSGMVGSGLMVISAFPIQETSFRRYSKNGKWYKPWQGDWYAGKGAARACIKLPEGSGYLDFYNTHAVAGYDGQNDLHVDDRIVQMKELAEFIESSSTEAVPAILVGDMNCKPGSIEYTTIVERAGIIRLTNIDSRIDHIFGVESSDYHFAVESTEEVSSFMTEAGENLRLSDHNCYVSTIQIESR